MKKLIPFLLFGNIFAGNIIDGNQMLNIINKQINNINTKTLINILDNNPNAVLIDVRTRKEVETVGTINRGANVVIPRGWLEFRVNNYPKDTEIITYCGTNLRSPLAAKTLMNMGFTNVSNYKDGYFEWKKQNLAIKISDNYLDSFLYNKVKKVTNNVWTSIGQPAPATYLNSGHNNNLSFVVGGKYTLVFNAGGSYLLAKSLHQEIKKITNKPVKYVVLENAQGHAILGSNYWTEQGAKIISHTLTKVEIEKHGDEILKKAKQRIGNKILFSKIIKPHQTFTHKLKLDLGNLKIELLRIGSSHSPDDIQLWIPSQQLLISGDMTFNQRMLPIFENTNIVEWIKAWGKIKKLNPKIIVPGHGDVTDFKTVTKFTKNYLQFMHHKIIQILENGGDLNDAYKIDQTQFKDWGTYRELHLRNAARIFQKLEFDY